jgi:predicted RNase H-like nuclease
MGPLTARAHYLRRALEGSFRLNENLLEVYPRASIHALCGVEAARRYKRHADTWRTRAEILETLAHELRFEVWREGCLENDHCFDAVICAYTGYLWAKEGWTLPEEDREVFERDGWIWCPPFRP